MRGSRVSRKVQYLILGIVLVLLVGGLGYYFFGRSDVLAAGSGGADVSAHDMTLGNPKAPVVLIEYAAPTCPHCAHFNATVMPLLKKEYIDTGKVYYVFRVFPLQPADGAAEKLARCLPARKYFAFMDLLFANQPKWDPEYGVSDVHGGLLGLAHQLGMTDDQFNRCLADTKQDAIINQVAAQGQAKYNIDRTPTLILNGTPQQDATEWNTLKPILDMALASK